MITQHIHLFGDEGQPFATSSDTDQMAPAGPLFFFFPHVYDFI
jgi:hypothetical protein